MSEELTETLPPNDEDRTTQPSITAVFELIQNVKQVVDSTAVRQNDLELQIQNVKLEIQSVKQVVDSIAARQDAIELQIKNGLTMVGHKIDILNRARLQTEADNSGLLQRVEELESKAS
ncbi:MAG: hypothetical protein AABO41_20125 [Acidobacteriota bacterium]